MLSKKRNEKNKSSLRLEKNITEILVANGRSIEPFVKVFQYEGENIAKESLGMLIGVFEISDRTEDSAYIVNFLASVARKEYFANPRRGAIESFESALHKVNIALAELVKHGNVEWLGKLEGALGILEKNNLHFSVTGGARILLLRNEGCTDISDGLASDESSLHPMKTFVEVASGHLEADDRLIFATPEVFNLLPQETLEKNAVRLADRFPQFLKTALVNELDMAGVIILSMSEGKMPLAPAPKPEKKKTEEPIAAARNVFSEQTFAAAKKEVVLEEIEISEEEKNEYIDSKTGHIYVHGETETAGSSSHPLLEKIGLLLDNLQPHFQSFAGSQKRFFKKSRKQSLIALDSARGLSLVAARKLWRAGRRFIRDRKKRQEEKASQTLSIEETPNIAPETRLSFSPESTPLSIPDTSQPIASEGEPLESPAAPEGASALGSWFHRETLGPNDAKTAEIPPETPRAPVYQRLLIRSAFHARAVQRHASRTHEQLKSKIRQQFSARKSSGSWQERLLSFGRVTKQKIISAYRLLPVRARLPLLVTLVLLFCGAAVLAYHSAPQEGDSFADAEPSLIESVLRPSLVPEGERNAFAAPLASLVIEQNERAIQPIFLNATLYLITETGVVNVSEKSFYPLPENSGKALKATAMEDLELLFIATDRDTLFSWSPITRSYAVNNLPLPESASIRSMGAYLTYLYVLDDATDQVYRFPRATGGFGAPTLWLREAVSIEDSSSMGVNETLFLTPAPATVEAYFQGRKTRTLEMPSGTLAITHLYTKPGSDRLYGLDKEHKRILIWNTEGILLQQYFSEEFGNASNITANTDNSEIFFSLNNKLHSFKLP